MPQNRSTARAGGRGEAGRAVEAGALKRYRVKAVGCFDSIASTPEAAGELVRLALETCEGSKLYVEEVEIPHGGSTP